MGSNEKLVCTGYYFISVGFREEGRDKRLVSRRVSGSGVKLADE